MCEHTIDERSQVLHVPDVIVCWPSGRADLAQNLLTQLLSNIWVLGEGVHSKSQSPGSLSREMSMFQFLRRVNYSPYLVRPPGY